MTAEEKGKEIISKCEDDNHFSREEIFKNAVFYARITVSEILKALSEEKNNIADSVFEWWEDVLKYIENAKP